MLMVLLEESSTVRRSARFRRLASGGPSDAGTAERVQTVTAARSKLEAVIVQIGPEEAGKRRCLNKGKK